MAAPDRVFVFQVISCIPQLQFATLISIPRSSNCLYSCWAVSQVEVDMLLCRLLQPKVPLLIELTDDSYMNGELPH